jgi:hypothetical protein
MTYENETMPGPRVLLGCGLEEAPPMLSYHTQLIHIHGNRARKSPDQQSRDSIGGNIHVVSQMTSSGAVEHATSVVTEQHRTQFIKGGMAADAIVTHQ